jgi:hypothetical protein
MRLFLRISIPKSSTRNASLNQRKNEGDLWNFRQGIKDMEHGWQWLLGTQDKELNLGKEYKS